jgi:hypothetical protein
MTDLELQRAQMKGYLGGFKVGKGFWVQPNKKSPMWGLASDLMGRGAGAWGLGFDKFIDVKYFGQAVLLSGGPYTWEEVSDYNANLLQFSNESNLEEYFGYDVLFILHNKGSLWNKMTEQAVNVLASNRTHLGHRTFFCSMGLQGATGLAFEYSNVVGWLGGPSGAERTQDKANKAWESI